MSTGNERRPGRKSRPRNAPPADLRAPDEEFEQLVARRLRDMEIADEARRRFAATRAGGRFAFPTAGRTLADDLATPPREQKYAVDRLHSSGGNTLLVAQYKAGKTTLLLNLMTALADEEP